MPRRPALLGCLAPVLALALASCAKVGRESGVTPLERSQLLARGRIAAVDGGALSVAGPGPFAGVAIEIPPGALTEDTEFEIHGRFGDQRLPSIVQTVEIRPGDIRLLAAATVTLRYSSVYAATAGTVWDESGISVYAFDAGPTIDERAYRAVERDEDRDLIRVETARLGTFYGMHPLLRSLVSQSTRLIDPAVPLKATLTDQRIELSDGGNIEAPIGKGSLDAFRSSPADRNLLVVPGLLGDPLLATTASGLVPPDPNGGLKRDFENVVVFQYPTGRSLRESANLLYDALRAGAGPEFGCNIVAHGSGGLVVRYALERAHLDPSRPGFADDQPQLDAVVDAVVLLGTPHQGAAVAQSRYDFLLSAVFETDLRFVRGVIDLLPTTDSFVTTLNADWQRPRTSYFAIAGDVNGARSDGLVDVLSALGVPRTYSRPDAHMVFSGPIYEHGSLLVFAAPIGILDQVREWFGKQHGNAPPVAGGIETPMTVTGGEVEIGFDLSDAESAVCFVTPLLSVDGSNWRIATPVDGSVPLTFPARPAPGATHVFRWDSVADRVGLGRSQRAVIRLMISDGAQVGTPGQSGVFAVDNR